MVTSKDLVSDQDIRWCPGCGDFAILKQVQNVIPKLDIPKHKLAFVSGIGCSSRFPYYMNTYGIHSIHGRAPAVATGLKLANPDLSVWIVTGDGDALSIGGNHFIHLMRRNLDINVLLFNNQVYGLTKGQYSPTSHVQTISKSTPYGSVDLPLNPLSIALASGARFIARSIDREAKHLQDMIYTAALHKGTSLLEIYQNCHIFNDGVFDEYTNKDSKKLKTLYLEEGKPLLFGENFGIIFNGMDPEIVTVDEENVTKCWIHDPKNRNSAEILVRFGDGDYAHFPKAFGVIYSS